MAATLSERSSIDEKYKWDLSPIYADDEAWEADLSSLHLSLEELASFQRRLGEGAEILLNALELHERVSRRADRPWQYAARNRDEDMTSPRSQGLFERAQQAGTELETSRGSSAYTIDLLRDAGVDMTTPEPVEQALTAFKETLEQVEQLCRV